MLTIQITFRYLKPHRPYLSTPPLQLTPFSRPIYFYTCLTVSTFNQAENILIYAPHYASPNHASQLPMHSDLALRTLVLEPWFRNKKTESQVQEESEPLLHVGQLIYSKGETTWAALWAYIGAMCNKTSSSHIHSRRYFKGQTQTSSPGIISS